MKPANNDLRWASLTLYAWIAYWILLFVATHIPIDPRFHLPLPVSDLVLHFTAYFLLALLGGVRLLFSQQRAFSTTLIWVGVYLAYAGLDEWIQSFVGRTMSLSDFLADAGGVMAATVMLPLAERIVRKSPPGRLGH